MMKFDLPFHASNIDEEAYQEILQSCAFINDVDVEAARFELGNIKGRYYMVKAARKDRSKKSEWGLSLKEQRDMFREILKITPFADRIDQAYLVEHDETFKSGEKCEFSEKPIYLIPSWLEPISDCLHELSRYTEKLSTDRLEELVTSGTDPDLAFHELIKNLAGAYEKFTGLKATCYTIRREEVDICPDPKNKPTNFQVFAEVCSRRFGIKTTSYFYNKVQKTMLLLNKQQRKAKQTTNTP